MKKAQKGLCVVIPIYKPLPSDNELFSIRNTIARLPSYDIFFIAPKGLDMAAYDEFSKVDKKKFPARFFKNLYGYNKLMLRIGFYSKFKNYTYMLLVQPDALIIRDDIYLNELISEYEYDYWGAPWIRPSERRCFDCELYHKWILHFYKFICFISPVLECEVGNGGLTLRNIQSTIRLLRRNYIYKILWGGPEDIFFSYFGKRCKKFFRLADKYSASKFALEETLHDNLLTHKAPFGVHDWKRYFPDVMKYFPAIQNDYSYFNKAFIYTNGQNLFFDAVNFNASPYIKSGFSVAQKDYSWTIDKNVEFQFDISDCLCGQTVYVNIELGELPYSVIFVDIYVNNEKQCMKIVEEKSFGFIFVLKETKITICLDILPFQYISGLPIKTICLKWGTEITIADNDITFYADQGLLLQKNYYIYGAGKIAQRFIEFLLASNLPKPAAVLVSSKTDNPDSFCGLPVVQADEVQNKESLVLIAVSEKFYEDVVNNLKSLDFRNF